MFGKTSGDENRPGLEQIGLMEVEVFLPAKYCQDSGSTMRIFETCMDKCSNNSLS